MSIELRGLSKHYRTGGETVAALEDIDLRIDQGEFVALVGPSGCGKSTLLGIAAGLVTDFEGEVRIDDRALERPDPQRIGVVFQDALLFPWETALDNAAYPLRLMGLARGPRRERAAGLLDLVGLSAFRERYPHELSGGMKQRVALARSLARDPDILLMDEPFANLDEFSRQQMGDELLRIWKQTGKSILFVTHSLGEAIYLADRVLVMSPRPGRIIAAVEVPLPRPRDPEMLGTAEFGALRNRLWRMLFQSTQT